MSQSNRQSQSRGSGHNTEATELQGQSLGRARLGSEDSKARGQKTVTETDSRVNSL